MKLRVLMVDDDVEALASLGREFSAERPDLEFEGCSDAEKALVRISEQPPWVLVAAQRMPGLSGLELLLLARELVPSLPVVVTSGLGSPEIRQELTRHRSLEYLVKPFDFAALLAAVERAASRNEGFSGNVSLPTLADLIQMYGQAHTTGRMTVSHAGEIAEIWFADGEVVHASCAGHLGYEAIYELVKWRGGSVRTSPGERTSVRSIEQSWQQLLLEAFCRLDESRKGGDEPAAPAVDLKPLERPRWDQANDASALQQSLHRLSQIDGFLGACVVDSDSGLMLGAEGGGAAIDLEIAAAGNTGVMRAKRKTMKSLGIKDAIEDMLITLGKQYHLLRPVSHKDGLFLYLVLDKSRSNLALARHSLTEVEREMMF